MKMQVQKSSNENFGHKKTGTGKKVNSKKQVIAIGLSEAKKEDAKLPKKK